MLLYPLAKAVQATGARGHSNSSTARRPAIFPFHQTLAYIVRRTLARNGHHVELEVWQEYVGPLSSLLSPAQGASAAGLCRCRLCSLGGFKLPGRLAQRGRSPGNVLQRETDARSKPGESASVRRVRRRGRTTRRPCSTSATMAKASQPELERHRSVRNQTSVWMQHLNQVDPRAGTLSRIADLVVSLPHVCRAEGSRERTQRSQQHSRHLALASLDSSFRSAHARSERRHRHRRRFDGRRRRIGRGSRPTFGSPDHPSRRSEELASTSGGSVAAWDSGRSRAGSGGNGARREGEHSEETDVVAAVSLCSVRLLPATPLVETLALT